MTPLQLNQAIALNRCTFSVGSFDKRFCRDHSGQALHRPEDPMTPAAAGLLAEMVHRYRRQIPGSHDRLCFICKPELVQARSVSPQIDPLLALVWAEPDVEGHYRVLADALQAAGDKTGEAIVKALARHGYRGLRKTQAAWCVVASVFGGPAVTKASKKPEPAPLPLFERGVA